MQIYSKLNSKPYDYLNKQKSHVFIKSLMSKILLCCMFVKVMVCSSMETSQRFVVKQVDGDDNAFAVRKVGLK